jgi:hypothetical protein
MNFLKRIVKALCFEFVDPDVVKQKHISQTLKCGKKEITILELKESYDTPYGPKYVPNGKYRAIQTITHRVWYLNYTRSVQGIRFALGNSKKEAVKNMKKTKYSFGYRPRPGMEFVC